MGNIGIQEAIFEQLELWGIKAITVIVLVGLGVMLWKLWRDE
ncbi:hypothetical protein Nhal_0977 [Nitrosococcus halophilus Nc 4]|uniref:Uncharacterized protein n=1 Tax=Nitrosococcus halophilus (strain Nc4) TaxID=472759 RepID=D5BYG7_NITHN|nr:hypothetical protein [Nitrosococcus halophilus]ADE14150.1 hypothetical protein Nhal_0977 [Nitrosococcus halophilus Nc 4]